LKVAVDAEFLGSSAIITLTTYLQRFPASETASECPVQETVILHRFIGEAKESKEGKGAYDYKPSAEFESDTADRISSPVDGKELVNTREVVVSIFPANPRVNADLCIVIKGEQAEGDGAESFDSSEAYETYIDARAEIGMALQKIIELCATSINIDDIANAIDSRDATYDHWRTKYKNICRRGDICRCPTAYILVNVVTVSLYDIVCIIPSQKKHKESKNLDVRSIISSKGRPRQMQRSDSTS